MKEQLAYQMVVGYREVAVRQLIGEGYVVVFSHQGVWLADGCLAERKQPAYMQYTSVSQVPQSVPGLL
jgi:hypothetical protein